MAAFKIESREFSLTWPKCNITSENMLSYFRVKFDEKLNYVAIVRELHEDGTPHLHGHIQFKKRFCSGERTFDFNNFHPNIQRTKNSEQWKKYLEKSGTPVISGLYEIITKKKIILNNNELLTMDLKKAVDDDIIKVTQLTSIMLARNNYSALCEKTGIDIPEFIPSPWQGIEFPVIYDKKRHYWLWSKAHSKGKTTFLKLLRYHYRVETYNLKENYNPFKINTQVVVFDEYAKGRSILATDMNAICDGEFGFPQKGREPVYLKEPLVIVCSNYPINLVYTNEDIIDRLVSRFTEINLEDSKFKELGILMEVDERRKVFI